MVVCQFFLAGRCKFGANCRYEHPASTSHTGHGGFLPHSKQFNEIMLEVISSERGNQWPLSCYAPIRDRPVVPALYDTSPEELRLSFYQAKKEGRVQDYLNRTNQLYTNAQEVRNFLKQPSAELGQLIENLSSGKQEVNLDPKSSFRFSLDNENRQGTQGSIFGNQPQPQVTPFSQVQENQQFVPSQSNLFSQPKANIFAQSNPAPSGTNIFGGAPQNSQFSNPPPTQSVFSQQTNNQDATKYSTELTDEEKAIYMAPMFTFGQIPQNPPTNSLC